MPRRRTFASGILAMVFGTLFTVLSDVATRLHIVGLGAAFGKLKTCHHRGRHIASGLHDATAPGPEGRVSTSGRRPAKKKSHDAMFFVKSPAGLAPAGGGPPRKNRTMRCFS